MNTTEPGHRTRSRRLRRIGVVVALTALFSLLATNIAAAQSMPNPFDGVQPDLGLLGPALNSTWKRALAALWGGCLVVAGAFVLTSGLSLKKSRKRGMSGDLSESTDEFRTSLLSLGIVAAATPIVGAVLFLVGG